MVDLQEQGYSQKDILNANIERSKLDNLEFLQKQSIPGPFTNSDQVKTCAANVPEDKTKNKRMY